MIFLFKVIIFITFFILDFDLSWERTKIREIDKFIKSFTPKLVEKRNRHQEYLELTIPDFITVRIFKQLSQV